MNGKEIVAVEREVSRYLPPLITWAQQPSLYQQSAAYLASQGCLLLSLVCLHQLHFKGRVPYCQQAVEHAKDSGNRNLLVRALIYLADAFCNNGQLIEMLQTYQEAEYYSKKSDGDNTVSPLLRSHLLAESAHAYALHGNVQEMFVIAVRHVRSSLGTSPKMSHAFC